MKKPKLVILDGYTSVQDDLDWNSFNDIADVVAYDRTPAEKIIERSVDADAVFTNKVPFFAEQLNALPNLKYIGILATGYNNVDIALANKLGITVCNIPAYGTDSVAQAVFAHILNIANRTDLHAQSVRNGRWCSSPDIAYCLTPQTQLNTKTIGIFGFGAIGRKVAKIACGFGMNVIAYSPSRTIGEKNDCAKMVSAEEIFSKSDIISLNCPLNDKTKEIINSRTLKLIKHGAWVINTGRGQLINENDLAIALKSGQIAFAGLDVLSTEPPTNDNPLLNLDNCFITPHNAWTTQTARKRLIKICFDNFNAWLKGNPINKIG